MSRKRLDPSFLAGWTRWWPVTPATSHAFVRCRRCNCVGKGTWAELAGWWTDRALSFMCSACATVAQALGR